MNGLGIWLTEHQDGLYMHLEEGKLPGLQHLGRLNSGSLSQTWYNVNVIVIDLEDGYAAIYMHLAQDLPVRLKLMIQYLLVS